MKKALGGPCRPRQAWPAQSKEALLFEKRSKNFGSLAYRVYQQ